MKKTILLSSLISITIMTAIIAAIMTHLHYKYKQPVAMTTEEVAVLPTPEPIPEPAPPPELTSTPELVEQEGTLSVDTNEDAVDFEGSIPQGTTAENDKENSLARAGGQYSIVLRDFEAGEDAVGVVENEIISNVNVANEFHKAADTQVGKVVDISKVNFLKAPVMTLADVEKTLEIKVDGETSYWANFSISNSGRSHFSNSRNEKWNLMALVYWEYEGIIYKTPFKCLCFNLFLLILQPPPEERVSAVKNITVEETTEEDPPEEKEEGKNNINVDSDTGQRISDEQTKADQIARKTNDEEERLVEAEEAERKEEENEESREVIDNNTSDDTTTPTPVPSSPPQNTGVVDLSTV